MAYRHRDGSRCPQANASRLLEDESRRVSVIPSFVATRDGTSADTTRSSSLEQSSTKLSGLSVPGWAGRS